MLCTTLIWCNSYWFIDINASAPNSQQSQIPQWLFPIQSDFNNTLRTHIWKNHIFTNTWQLVKPRVICEYLSGSSNSPYELADENNCYQVQEDRIALIIMGFRYSTDPIMCPCACPGDVAWTAVSSPEYFISTVTTSHIALLTLSWRLWYANVTVEIDFHIRSLHRYLFMFNRKSIIIGM